MSEFESTQSESASELMVRDYLATQLDSQLGKAQQRFRGHVQNQPPARTLPARFPTGGRFRGWMFTVAGSAIAASLGFLAASPHLRSASSQPGPVNPSTPVDLPWVQSTAEQQTYDAGTYVNENGEPVHVLKRRNVARTKWFDEKKQLKAESVVPEDETVYLKMNTY